MAQRFRRALKYRNDLEDGSGPRFGQNAIAKAAGVSEPSVSAWFTGATKPDQIKAEPLLRAAQFLRVRPEWLVFGTGPMVTKAILEEGMVAAPLEPLTRRPPWPFPGVDEARVAKAKIEHRRLLSGALLVAAGEIGIDIRKRQSA